MLKYFLITGCIGSFVSSFAAKPSVPETGVKPVIVKLIKNSNRIKSLISAFSANSQERMIAYVKPISLEGSIERDMMEDGSKGEFGSPKLNGRVVVGVSTFLDIKAENARYNAEFYSSTGPSMKDVDELICEYVDLLAKYNLKLELLEITKEYIEERRRDLKEYAIRMQHGDLAKDEFMEAKVGIAETEATFANLMNDIQVHKNALILYMDLEKSQNKETELFSSMTLEELDDFLAKSGVFASNAQIKAGHKLEQASAEMLSSITQFTPQVRVDFTRYLSEKLDEDKREKHRLGLGLFINLSPSSFFKTLQMCKRYESAKSGRRWEEQKNKYDYARLYARFMAERLKKDNAKLNMQAKKVALESAIKQYKSGVLDYKKMREMREQYYHAVERYYDAAERYIREFLEYLKITGILREIFLEEYNKDN